MKFSSIANTVKITRRKSKSSLEGRDYRKKNYSSGIQRRQDFRVVYPPSAAPEILDYDFRVVDLSAKGIKFACPVGTELPEPGEIIRFTIKFGDCDTHSLKATILRKNENAESEEIYVACTIEPMISIKKINEQQRYLIKHYPDFCRTYF